MATIKKSIFKRNKNGKAELVVRFTHNRLTNYFHTKLYIDVECWDTKNLKVKNSFSENQTYNTILHNLYNEVHGAIDILVDTEQEPTFKAVKQVIYDIQPQVDKLFEEIENEKPKNKNDLYWFNRGREYQKQLQYFEKLEQEQKFNNYKEPVKTPIFAYWDEWFEQYKIDTRKKTWRMFPSAKKHLENYKHDTTIEDCTVLFYKQFKAYLNTECNLVDNSAYQVIKRIKTYLLWCNKNKNTNIIGLDEWKIIDTPSNLITLTDAEVWKIEDLHLEDKSLDDARNILLVMMYAFCRYSDLEQMNKAQYRMGKLRQTQDKEDNEVVIKFNAKADAIIKKYENFHSTKLLPVPDNATFNKQIKEVCRLAGINELTEIVQKQGTSKKKQYVEKWQAISSHNLRKTGITLQLQFGTPATAVMQQSGHRDSKSFERYVVHSKVETDTQIVDSWSKMEDKKLKRSELKG